MYNYHIKLVDSSRFIADMLVKDIGIDSNKFKEMLALALQDKYPLSMRAARVIALCTDENPVLIEPYVNQIVDALGSLQIDGVKRSFLKILAETSVTPNEESIGKLTDLAFTWLDDPLQAIAIRYYCIEILLKVADLYPEIGNELQILLNTLTDDDSSGLKSKSRKALSQMRKKKG